MPPASLGCRYPGGGEPTIAGVSYTGFAKAADLSAALNEQILAPKKRSEQGHSHEQHRRSVEQPLADKIPAEKVFKHYQLIVWPGKCSRPALTL